LTTHHAEARPLVRRTHGTGSTSAAGRPHPLPLAPLPPARSFPSRSLARSRALSPRSCLSLCVGEGWGLHERGLARPGSCGAKARPDRFLARLDVGKARTELWRRCERAKHRGGVGFTVWALNAENNPIMEVGIHEHKSFKVQTSERGEQCSQLLHSNCERQVLDVQVNAGAAARCSNG
jgi:hypothetical protein